MGSCISFDRWINSLTLLPAQVVLLHHMMSKATAKARPNVIWCYKELGFSSHRKKMKQLQKKI